MKRHPILPGKPLPGPIPLSAAKRLLIHCEVGGVPDGFDTACWLWKGGKDKDGYGFIKVFGKSCVAHRVAYQLFKGAPPEGITVHHGCFVRNCINPEHLSLLPHTENCGLHAPDADAEPAPF